MQQSRSQLSLAPSSVAQSVSAYSTDQLASHAYWMFKKNLEHFSLDSLEERGRKREILWTGIRGPIDAANARAIRCEDPILLCSTGADAVITGILEATSDPIPDATAWDPEFSRKHWVSPPDRLEPGCSIGYNPYWAVRVQLVARLEQPVRLRALSEHPAWQGSDVWDADRMLIPVTMEQWDVVIDMAADMKCTPLHAHS